MSTRPRPLIGHLSALITIVLWGTTFISTKILLVHFQPMEILLIRFVIGLVALFMVYPKLLKFTNWRNEATFALAGLLGISLYYLLENFALTYTLAANIGVIVSTSPFFTAMIDALLHHKKLSNRFMLGFVAAMFGIGLISFGGSTVHFNLLGDILALLAAIVWATYSHVVTYMNTFHYNGIQMTRRTFLYGVIFILPVFGLTHGQLNFGLILQPLNFGNLLFLGIGASALCFVTWALAVKTLGPVRTSIYIYLVPVITVITAMLILHEPVTIKMVLGIILAIAGLVISDR